MFATRILDRALLCLLVAAIVAGLVALADQNAAIAVVMIGYLAILVIQFLPAIQRSHDMNVTGWLC